MSSENKGFLLVGACIGVVIACLCLCLPLDIQKAKYQREAALYKGWAIGLGYAHYHPKTGEFQLKDSSQLPSPSR